MNVIETINRRQSYRGKYKSDTVDFATDIDYNRGEEVSYRYNKTSGLLNFFGL